MAGHGPSFFGDIGARGNLAGSHGVGYRLPRAMVVVATLYRAQRSGDAACTLAKAVYLVVSRPGPRCRHSLARLDFHLRSWAAQPVLPLLRLCPAGGRLSVGTLGNYWDGARGSGRTMGRRPGPA